MKSIIKNKIIISVISLLGFIMMIALLVNVYKNTYSDSDVQNEKTTMNNIKHKDFKKNIAINSYIEKGEKVYKYVVYSEKNKKIYEEKTYKYPNIKRVNQHIYYVGISAGTSVYLVRYFDLLNERISDVFETPLDIMDNKIIIYNGKKGEIIVQDIFDKSKYYEEIELKSSDAVFPIVFARFLSTDTIQVRYMTGNDYEEKTKTFRLKK